jgi:G3E family GTPase
MDEFFDTLYEPPIDKWFEIGSILTVADAESPALLPTQTEYLLGSEAACCGKIIVSKLGKTDEPAESVTQRVLTHINRALLGIQCDRQLREEEVFTKDWDDLTDADFAMLANAGYRGASYVKLFSADMIHSEVHYFMRLAIDPEQIEQTVQEIFADPACGRLYRIKGSLPNGKGGWLRLNAVNGTVQLTPSPLGQPVLIAIGDDLDRAAIDRHFLAVNTDPDYLSL